MSFIVDRYYQMLENHKLYNLVNSPQSLVTFLESHVVCVWGYHALLRSLYKDLVTKIQNINSDSSKECLRLITEVVLDEVVEDLGDGQFQSHLELYIEAMEDAGANVSPILTFFDMLEKGFAVRRSLELSGFTPESVRYAKTIVGFLNEPMHKKAAALFYEGEPFIPDHFLGRIESLGQRMATNLILDYFEGHIEGLKRPGFSATGRLVEILCCGDKVLHEQAEKVAEKIMKTRLELWNCLGNIIDLQEDDLPVLRVIAGGKELGL
ncbi:MAG: DUF3050 domain-containing protein [Pseudobacteriovorax sp.]|nr:DUF3050 domain-containing protein [Pseudobacteriovorax sp.]